MITMTNPTHTAVARDEVVVRAFNSITLKQADAVAAIVRASKQEWNVDAGDDYDGYRFVLIETVGHGDEQKSFFVAGTAQRLELFEGKGESLVLIGAFSDMQTLGARLTELICPQ